MLNFSCSACAKIKQVTSFLKDFIVVVNMVFTTLVETVTYDSKIIMAVDPRGGRNRVGLQSQIIGRTAAPSENWE